MTAIVRSLIVLVILGASSATAETTLAETSLEDILRNLWKTSPQLDGQSTQLSLASGDRWRRFVINEPQLQYTNSDDDTARAYGLTLTTSFPGKTLAFTRLDAARAGLQEAELRAKRFDLSKTVVQAYLDCAAAQTGYELQKTTSGDLNTIFRTLRIQYESGHSTQAEKISAELLARQAELDLLAAQDKQEVSCKRFASVVAAANGEVSREEAVPIERKLTLPDDLDSVLISELGPITSDQGRAVASIETSDAISATAGWSQLPDFTLFANRNHYISLAGSPSGKEWTTTYGLQFTVPLLFPFHETVEANRARSQAQIDRNAAELQKIAADSDQLDSVREYRRSRDRLQILRSRDLPLGRALMESALASYRAGKLGYSELVLARKTLTDLKTQEIQLRVSVVNAHLRCLSRCLATEKSP